MAEPIELLRSYVLPSLQNLLGDFLLADACQKQTHDSHASHAIRVVGQWDGWGTGYWILHTAYIHHPES